MLTKWETLFLLFMTLAIMGHVVILPPLYDVAGRDAWISALFSFPVGVLFVWAIYRLRLLFSGYDFPTISSTLLSKPVGTGLIFVLDAYYLFLSGYSAAALAEMINIGFLPETPVSALVLWLMLFCLYAANKRG
ncbi:hypothetical protein J2S00_002649 [Caldalkalibacillus uzonensis]|uniref:Uncharacterized protein n=1 Tax=Caldalkalibacillus uzonensis TaxID=353224 RepID=A0ABU0CVD5_9BACI|nr:GerAB/ArcD/ProY family transporter [Caldalkalibacillus uzonensis]MDQ0339856.1 hypothetical protein [Caldalkalibacillus uzonensis]